MAKEPNRSVKTKQDLGAIDAIQHNDAVGGKKVILVEPTIIRSLTANTIVGAGRLIKVGGATYGLDMLGRVYSASMTYMKGDVVTNSTFVYLALQDNITGAFDDSKWRKVADKQITGIPTVAGNIVSTGRWHNCITVAGWLVDDESSIEYTRIRD